MSCKELGEAIYESPQIKSLEISPGGTVLPGDTVTAVVSADNPEKGTLSYSWEVSPDRGVFLPPTDMDTIKWIAPLVGDEYTIKAIVRNDKKSTETKNVVVQSLDKPYVRIISPANNSYFAQMQEIEVIATAYHDNNLSKVWLLIDNVVVDSLDWNSSDEYKFNYSPDLTKIGEVELRVMAEALGNQGNTSSDYVTVSIEGIVPKTGNP
jgi:hypothetical protein